MVVAVVTGGVVVVAVVEVPIRLFNHDVAEIQL